MLSYTKKKEAQVKRQINAGEVQANPDEISEVRWVELDELSRDLQMHPEKYCAWFLIAAPKVIKKIQEEWED